MSVLGQAVATRTGRSAFRPEIEGIRAVACLLVAVFHIWLGRVSGGVDVFFTVAGFLVTLTLLSMIERSGAVQPGAFLARLARRLMPASLTVIVAVLVLTLVLLPVGAWSPIFGQVTASAVYGQNWFLAFNAVDYLATDVTKSPLQHLWATSIQGQFYVIWLLLAIVAALISTRWKRVRAALAIVIAPVVVLSLAYSIVTTATTQAFAYFDTFSRAWEFGIGGLVALALPWLRIPPRWAAALGWLGLVGILTCGLILPVSTVFPGYAALWPTLSAALVIVSGGQGGRWGADRLLGSRPFVWLGGLSYGIYLWHWPVLIFALTVQGRGRAGLLTGCLVIVVSIALAWATTRFIERPFREAGSPGRLSRRSATAIVLVASVVAALGGVAGSVSMARAGQAELERAAALYEQPCFGAAALVNAPEPCVNPELGDAYYPLVPTDDNQPISAPECRTPPEGSGVEKCEWGTIGADTRVVLIGNSHAAAWFSALLPVIEGLGWQLDTYYKSSCTFNGLARWNKDPAILKSCAEWSKELSAVLAADEPYDYVFTSANGGNMGLAIEGVPMDPAAGADGYHEVWQPLIDRGATILAMRDYPRSSPEILECGLATPGDPACFRPQDVALTSEEDEVLVRAARTIEGAVVLDMTRWFCVEERCMAVIGNVHVYRDAGHLTNTYATSLAPFLWDELSATAGFPEPPATP